MIKIKGLHNAIKSGIAAGKSNRSMRKQFYRCRIEIYRVLNTIGVIDEMKIASRFRQNGPN
jgi:hypothetical protein